LPADPLRVEMLRSLVGHGIEAVDLDEASGTVTVRGPSDAMAHAIVALGGCVDRDPHARFVLVVFLEHTLAGDVAAHTRAPPNVSVHADAATNSVVLEGAPADVRWLWSELSAVDCRGAPGRHQPDR